MILQVRCRLSSYPPYLSSRQHYFKFPNLFFFSQFWTQPPKPQIIHKKTYCIRRTLSLKPQSNLTQYLYLPIVQRESYFKFIGNFRWNANKSYAKALVKISACWNSEGTCITLMSLWRTSSRRKWWRTLMRFEFEFVIGFCASCTAPWLSSKTGKHGMTLLGNIKRQICLKNNNSFTASPRATYSASEVERVTHFWVLENQHTLAPPHMITPPDTDRLSVALKA